MILGRHVWRTLRRSPGVALATIGTVGLTIALGATVFAVVDGVLFRALPYPAPDRLFTVYGTDAVGERASFLSLLDAGYLAAADPRVHVAAFGATPPTLTHPDRPDRLVMVHQIDERFFDVLGRHPLIGGFSPADFVEAPAGSPRPVILSHAFWRQALGEQPDVIGLVVQMLEERVRVVGVLPEDFVFPRVSSRFQTEMLTPLILPSDLASDRWGRELYGLARLDPEIASDEAQSRLDASLARRVDEYSARDASVGPYVAVRLESLNEHMGRLATGPFRLAFGTALVLILLGAVNVAALTTARARARHGELTTRIALGARPRDVMGLLLLETALLAVIGGGVGLLLAGPGLTATLALLPESLPPVKVPVIDWRVGTFALVMAVVPAICATVLPVARSSSAAMGSWRPGCQGITNVGRRLRASLLAVECALGIVLVLAGALMVTSFATLRAQDVGLDVEQLAVIQLRMTDSASGQVREAREALVLDRLQRVPGVRAVATMDAYLFEGIRSMSAFRPPTGATRGVKPTDVPVSGAFFGLAGLRLVAGRLPGPREFDEGRPVAVVSERIARSYWPGRSAVGQVLESDGGRAAVVGVVEDVALANQAEDAVFGEIYVPRAVGSVGRTLFLIEAADDPDRVVEQAAAAIHADVPGVLVRRAESLDAALSYAARGERFQTLLVGITSAAALLLLAVGVAGLVSADVAQRVREIGIRSALGAERGRLSGMITLEALRPAAAGLVLGLLVSWWFAEVIGSYLYGIHEYEPLVWVAASAALLSVTVLGAWLPARRASRVDPMVALRAE